MSEKINKEERAFPFAAEYGHPAACGGMFLRDWFAGMALQGLISGCFAGNNQGFTVQGNVVAAYEYADAMLAARGSHE